MRSGEIVLRTVPSDYVCAGKARHSAEAVADENNRVVLLRPVRPAKRNVSRLLSSTRPEVNAQAEALAEAIGCEVAQAVAHPAPTKPSPPPSEPLLHRLDDAVFKPETQIRLKFTLETLDRLREIRALLRRLHAGLENGSSTPERQVETQGRGGLKVGRGEGVRRRLESLTKSGKGEKVGAERGSGKSAVAGKTGAELQEVPPSVCRMSKRRQSCWERRRTRSTDLHPSRRRRQTRRTQRSWRARLQPRARPSNWRSSLVQCSPRQAREGEGAVAGEEERSRRQTGEETRPMVSVAGQSWHCDASDLRRASGWLAEPDEEAGR